MTVGTNAQPQPDQRALFAYPEQAAFGRVLPKTKVYAFGKPTRRVRDLITQQVAQIVWQHKLAPDTLNLPPNRDVQEVQVFRIELKPDALAEPDDLPEDVLRAIDKAIASPIIYELVDGQRIRCVAAYKRPNESAPGNAANWVVGDYFGTGWMPRETPREPLPVALDMAGLYEHLLRRLMPIEPRPGESMKQQTERFAALAVKQRECRRLEAQLRRERQFNRKVELNAQLRHLKDEVQTLTQ